MVNNKNELLEYRKTIAEVLDALSSRESTQQERMSSLEKPLKDIRYFLAEQEAHLPPDIDRDVLYSSNPQEEFSESFIKAKKCRFLTSEEIEKCRALYDVVYNAEMESYYEASIDKDKLMDVMLDSQKEFPNSRFSQDMKALYDKIYGARDLSLYNQIHPKYQEKFYPETDIEMLCALNNLSKDVRKANKEFGLLHRDEKIFLYDALNRLDSVLDFNASREAYLAPEVKTAELILKIKLREDNIGVSKPPIGTEIEVAHGEKMYTTAERPFVVSTLKGNKNDYETPFEWYNAERHRGKKFLASEKTLERLYGQYPSTVFCDDGRDEFKFLYEEASELSERTFYAKHKFMIDGPFSIQKGDGEIIKGNEYGIPHGTGDYIVSADLDFTDEWIVNGRVFDDMFTIEKIPAISFFYDGIESQATYLTTINNLRLLDIYADRVREELISHDGTTIKGIEHPTVREQMIAIDENPNSIDFIEEPSEEAKKLCEIKEMEKEGENCTEERESIGFIIAAGAVLGTKIVEPTLPGREITDEMVRTLI